MCTNFFFFKQKTAYELRISDWSSDVCSSDLLQLFRRDAAARPVILADTVEHGDDIVAHRNGADASGRVAIAVEYRCRCDRLQLPVGGHGPRARARDRESVVEGKSVSESVDHGGCRYFQEKK